METALTTNTVIIKNSIYYLRNKQVMLDSDLANLYNVETKNLNKAANRNIERFPEDFRFRLTKEEYENLRFQIGTSSENKSEHGGRRYYPYAYTEQGIAMLASVLHTEIAVQASVNIMRAFVEMRHFITNNALLFEKVRDIELKQLEYQNNTDERFNKVFQYIEDHAETEQKVFFQGQIYDAFSLITSLIQKAKKEIILIDNYCDVATLNLLAKKSPKTTVKLYTRSNTKLSDADIATFNAQYPTLQITKTSAFHDRFIILDGKTTYHIGASLKDAGKKCFAISLIKDPQTTTDLLKRL
ncbi:MAG: ORF6N domain-containing protein [Clostridia bacterium]|nr:ORF6N domain-containing protein [Clostridia bacterium]